MKPGSSTMKKLRTNLSVSVGRGGDESLQKKSSMHSDQGESEKHVLEIMNDANNIPSASSDGASLRYGSPFAPNPRGIGAEQAGVPSEMSKSSHRHMYSEQELYRLEKKAAPEKELTLFAMRLAVLEKLATTVGTLGFIWATVVILGGYAITLKEIDFWFVTVILVTEGARIFSRSHQLEWQHRDPGTRTITRAYHKGSDVIHRSARAIGRAFSHLVSPHTSQSQHLRADGSVHLGEVDLDKAHLIRQSANHVHLGRVWSASQVSFLPFMRLVFQAKHVSAALYCMQILSAVLSIGLSVWRLSQSHDYTRPNEQGTSEANHVGALIVFYSLTVFEALVFLLEVAYWQYNVAFKNILYTVSNNCRLELDYDCYTVRRFFYDVYAKCLTESVFEGLKMDLVDYALQWIQSDLPVEQLNGVRTLLALSCHPDSSQETLRTIGTRQGAVERLLEMVTWKNDEEQDIREAAGNLLCELVSYDRTGIRVAAISGSVEAIFSLLVEGKMEDTQTQYAHEYARIQTLRKIVENPIVAARVQVGLKVLINMAKNSINCAKVGGTRGLLPRLISFINANGLTSRHPVKEEQENTVSFLSLQLLSLLAACPGTSGKYLREDISKVLVSITSLRNILNSNEHGHHFKELAASTLSSLSMNPQVREVIGRTGGVVSSLLHLFLNNLQGDKSKEQMKVAIKAGEALTLLALQDLSNCNRMLRLRLRCKEQEGQVELLELASASCLFGRSQMDAVGALVEMMEDHHRGHLAIFILQCFYDNNVEKAHKICIAASTFEVMKLAMVDKENDRSQVAAIGLLARTLPYLEAEKAEDLFSRGEYTKEGVSTMVLKKLEAYKEPSMTRPQVRRACLELVGALVDVDTTFFSRFFAKSNRFARCLDNVMATSSELENYATFSGAIGVASHSITMEELAQRIIEKIHLESNVSS